MHHCMSLHSFVRMPRFQVFLNKDTPVVRQKTDKNHNTHISYESENLHG